MFRFSTTPPQKQAPAARVPLNPRVYHIFPIESQLLSDIHTGMPWYTTFSEKPKWFYADSMPIYLSLSSVTLMKFTGGRV